MNDDAMSDLDDRPFRARRTRRRLWGVLVIVLAAGGATFVTVRAIRSNQEKRRTDEEIMTYPVVRGDLHITVTETGTLKAKRSQRLWADIDGRAKIAWIIDEGTTVDSGAELVVMETEELKTQIANTQIELNQATAARLQAEEQLIIQVRQSASDTQAAAVKLDIAKLELARYQEGEIPKLLRDAALRLDRARVDLQLAEEDLVGMDEYVAKGYFTKKDHETRKLALRAAKDALETAQKDRELLEKYQIPKDLAQKQSDVNQAQTALDLADRKAQSELAQKTAELEQRRFVEQLRRDRLVTLTQRLAQMVIRAPSRGLVVYGDDRQWWQRGDIQVGMDVWRGRVLITLPDLDELEVTASINEVDLDKIKEGQRATVVLEAYPSLKFRGRVSRVATLADRQGGRGRVPSDVSTFEVTVEVDMNDARATLARPGGGQPGATGGGNGANGRLRPGMNAKVEIDVATLRDVLYIPLDAVYEDRGQHGCYVVRNGEAVWRPIEIGLSNYTHVHVKQGLSEGDRVARYDPRRVPGARAAATRPAGPTTQPTTQPAGRPTSRPGGGRRGTRGRPPESGGGA